MSPAPLLPTGGGYSALPISNFGGGLNLASGHDDPNIFDAGQCIDCLNVLFTQLGAVRQRPGYAAFTTSALTNRPDSLAPVYTASGTKRLLVGNGNKINAIDTSGASVANTTAPTVSPHFFARFAAPGSEEVYIANGIDTVRKYVPSTDTFSTPGYTGTTPTGKFLAVSNDFRLVNARLASNPSRVLFSDPGLPTTFGVNNYVDLDPGDGEQIMGMVSFRELLFVFKETKFYVFTGTSTDTSGNPVFNFRAVRQGIGLCASQALARARDGVYFLCRTGVYKTTGGLDVTPVSQGIDPFFLNTPAIYFKSSPAALGSITAAAMTFYNERIYLSIPTGGASTNDRMLVYDPRYGWWTIYDIPASCLTSWRPSQTDELVFGYAAGTNNIGRHFDSAGYAADALASDGTGGTAIAARWRSGWYTYYVRYRGRWYPELVVSTVRQGKLWGEGQVLCQLSKDYEDVFTPAASVTLSRPSALWGDGTDPTNVWGDGTDSTNLWGPAGTTRPALVRGIGIRGSVYSLQFSNSVLNRTFAVHQWETHLRGVRRHAIVETED